LIPVKGIYYLQTWEGGIEGDLEMKRLFKTIVGTCKSATSDWCERFSDWCGRWRSATTSSWSLRKKEICKKFNHWFYISSFSVITETKSKTIRKWVILNLICGMLLVPLR